MFIPLEIKCMKWPLKIAISYMSIIITLALAFFMKFYIPSPGLEGEIYIPYLYVSGPVVWIVSNMLSIKLVKGIEFITGYDVGSVVAIVIIPGILNWILGSMQWYYIVKLITHLLKRHKTNQKREP